MKQTNGQKPLLKKFGDMAFSRFVVAGVINTGITYLLYLAVLQFFPYVYAYSVAYATGIILGYILNARWVFKKSPNIRTAASYPVVYVLNYIFGITMLWLFINVFRLPEEIAPLFVVVLSVPLMYFLSKRIFTGKKQHEEKEHHC